MIIQEKIIKGVFEINLQPYEDNRGFFMRTYDDKIFEKYNLNKTWVQENQSYSKFKGILRGLHFQFPPYSENKIIRVVSGTIFMVFVDLRRGSLTLGKWESVILSAENKKMLFVPKCFALGMCTLTDHCTLLYKMDNYYTPESQGVIKWDDEDLGINWPMNDFIMSERDLKAPSFKQFIEKYNGL